MSKIGSIAVPSIARVRGGSNASVVAAISGRVHVDALVLNVVMTLSGRSLAA